jgi:2,4-dienoyl-CoA reductase-like NADH-dependent reductase (Old Yellow Enzyme family)
MGVGYAQVPGIWFQQQIEAWKPVTASVHAHGGRIFQREYRAEGWLGPDLKREFRGVYIANEQFTCEAANQVLATGEADAVAFGKLFTQICHGALQSGRL